MLQPPGSHNGAGSRNVRRQNQGHSKNASTSPDDQVRLLQRLPPNKRCCDCRAKLPSCVNLTVGSFVCPACAGIHRELNQRVKGVGHSSFTDKEVEFLQSVGNNDLINAIYLATYDDAQSSRGGRIQEPKDNTDPQHLKTWIRRKYVDRAWYRPSSSTAAAPHPTQQPPHATIVAIPPTAPGTAGSTDFWSNNNNHASPAPAWDAFGSNNSTATTNAGSSQSGFGPAQSPPPQAPNVVTNFANFNTAPPPTQHGPPNPGQQLQQQQQAVNSFANFEASGSNGNGIQQQPNSGFANFNSPAATIVGQQQFSTNAGAQQQPPLNTLANLNASTSTVAASGSQQPQFRSNTGVPQQQQPVPQISAFSNSGATSATTAPQPQPGFANFNSGAYADPQQYFSTNSGSQQPQSSPQPSGIANLNTGQAPATLNNGTQLPQPGFANFNATSAGVAASQQYFPQNNNNSSHQAKLPSAQTSGFATIHSGGVHGTNNAPNQPQPAVPNFNPNAAGSVPGGQQQFSPNGNSHQIQQPSPHSSGFANFNSGGPPAATDNAAQQPHSGFPNVDGTSVGKVHGGQQQISSNSNSHRIQQPSGVATFNLGSAPASPKNTRQQPGFNHFNTASAAPGGQQQFSNGSSPRMQMPSPQPNGFANSSTGGEVNKAMQRAQFASPGSQSVQDSSIPGNDGLHHRGVNSSITQGGIPFVQGRNTEQPISSVQQPMQFQGGSISLSDGLRESHISSITRGMGNLGKIASQAGSVPHAMNQTSIHQQPISELSEQQKSQHNIHHIHSSPGPDRQTPTEAAKNTSTDGDSAPNDGKTASVYMENHPSKFTAGQTVYYKSSTYVGKAKIMKVHLDDDLEPFYTILVDGKEKQTDNGHLSERSPLEEKVQELIGSLTEDQLLQVHQFIIRFPLTVTSSETDSVVPPAASATIITGSRQPPVLASTSSMYPPASLTANVPIPGSGQQQAATGDAPMSPKGNPFDLY
jgi:hypothetical protein